jgi:hypothetical protein
MLWMHQYQLLHEEACKASICIKDPAINLVIQITVATPQPLSRLLNTSYRHKLFVGSSEGGLLAWAWGPSCLLF